MCHQPDSEESEAFAFVGVQSSSLPIECLVLVEGSGEAQVLQEGCGGVWSGETLELDLGTSFPALPGFGISSSSPSLKETSITRSSNFFLHS